MSGAATTPAAGPGRALVAPRRAATAVPPRRAVAARRPPPRTDAQRLAAGLGLFSIALGAAELLAPHAFSRAFGLRGRERLVAAYGVREIATGIAILTARNPAPFVWGRVAGDALDLATLAIGLGSASARRRTNAGLGMLAVLGVGLVDALCAQALEREARPFRRGALTDYGNRTGFPRPAAAMRGAARDFEVPRDFRIPEPLRPWTTAA
jgi:hypothetical protein